MVKARFINGTAQIDIRSESQVKSVGMKLLISHSNTRDRDLPNQHTIGAITGLTEALDDCVDEAELEAALLEKQDVIHDLSEIREGATLGATAVQPNELESYATTQYVDDGLSGKQDTLTAGANIQIVGNTISATDTTYTAGTGISIAGNVISNTQTSAEWGNITGTLSVQTDLQNALNAKANVADIPTATSDLINDSRFITLSALNGYATETWVENKGYLTEIPAEYVTDSELTAKNYTTMLEVEAKGYITNSALTSYATQNYVNTALTNKQDTLTQIQLDAVNSGANTTNINQIATNRDNITTINSLIPNQATSSNQLADKDFVNSSIATNTATFRGTYNSVAELNAYSGEKDNNDYAFVAGEDGLGNTYYDNYVYNGTSWVYRWRLNNSSFTAAQWASINSGVTSDNVTDFTAHIANTSNPHEVTKAQVGLDNVDNTSDLDKPISTATQVALNSKQDTISDLETIRSGAALGATAIQSSDLATVATSGSYDDLSDKPTIPAAQVNSDWNATSGVARILNKPTIPTVPTNVSAFTNDAGYITNSALSGYATENYVASAVSGKQDTLVSGTNIKTINNQSLLGSGNIDIQGGGSSYTAGAGIVIENNEISVDGQSTTEIDSEQVSEIDTEQVSEITLATVATSGDYADLSNKPIVDQTYNSTSANAQSGVAIAGVLGDIETLLHNVNSGS